ncbi:hypothetical protein QN399_26745, partial [Pseudomonas sp. 10C3]|uniref:hypothetical protein n=1 Tax=Pseudomonas sp. 10C3 TaxID=3118753 RepID=UPI002E801219
GDAGRSLAPVKAENFKSSTSCMSEFPYLLPLRVGLDAERNLVVMNQKKGACGFVVGDLCHAKARKIIECSVV